MYRFYAPTYNELNMLEFAINNEESLELPQKTKEKILDYLNSTKNKQLVIEELTHGVDGVWYIISTLGDSFYCYELSDEFLERTNYGMA